jgi:hypothetical protein
MKTSASISHSGEPLQAVRESFYNVAKRSKFVKINYDYLDKYSDELPSDYDSILDEDHHFVGNVEETASYIISLECVNFGSGYKPEIVSEGSRLLENSIYFNMSTKLKAYYEENGALTAEQLSLIKPKQCADIFGLNVNGKYSQELATLFSQSMREMGHKIIRDFGGSFNNFILSADGSAEQFVNNLVSLSFFNDEHAYKGLKVVFYKRAQHLAGSINLAYKRLGLDGFNDISKLTMFADNAVPHVLHIDGVLEYSQELKDHLASGKRLRSGSQKEIEIRGCAGYAVEQIADIKRVNPVDLDYVLWHRKTQDKIYKSLPPHRTHTIFY